jgi:hypothetical protein
MGNGLKYQRSQFFTGVVVLLFGSAVVLYLFLDFLGMRGAALSNPFTTLVWSILGLAALAFSGGAAVVGGAWIISSARKQRSQL